MNTRKLVCSTTTALLLLAALAMPVQARIVYTPVNVILPANGFYPIDLNHDGTIDFTFQTSLTTTLCYPLPSLRFILTVQPGPAGGIVGGSWASALQSGVLIDIRQSFYVSDDLLYDVQQESRCTRGHSYGYWVAVQHGYLGFEFQINGQPHYGWAELSTNVTTGGVDTLYGFAYETMPFKGILTGQTMDLPDEPGIGIDSVEPEDSGPTASVAPPLTAAQDNPLQDQKSKHHQYKLKDLGTLGGPQSIIFGLTRPLNNQGVVTGCADISTLDPNNPQNPYFFQPNYSGGLDPYIQQAFQWQDGVLKNLGTLPSGTSSCTQWTNESGLIVGGATTGAIDPLTGYPEVNAVLWRNGHIRNLGTLGGNESVAFGLNNRGQAVGFALNAIPDPYTTVLAFGGTQAHAFLWQDGAMQDLGTLGGPDSIAYIVNERGQVAGASFTNSTPNPTTGYPTYEPFLWEDGKMSDLGTLGGTAGGTNDMNNRGQVVGNSNLLGDTSQHPFLWDKRKGLIDLGTFGGSNGTANWLNDAGEVVGQADLPVSGHDAFLWKKGVLTDLGNLGLTSAAQGINSSSQVVGGSRINSTTVHAFIWENGGPMVDLNSLIPRGSGLTLTEGWSINDRGEIAGWGQLASGDVHVVLLVPCDDKHPGECEDYSMIEAPASQPSAATAESSAAAAQHNESPEDAGNPSRNRFGRGLRISGQPQAPRD